MRSTGRSWPTPWPRSPARRTPTTRPPRPSAAPTPWPTWPPPPQPTPVRSECPQSASWSTCENLPAGAEATLVDGTPLGADSFDLLSCAAACTVIFGIKRHRHLRAAGARTPPTPGLRRAVGGADRPRPRLHPLRTVPPALPRPPHPPLERRRPHRPVKSGPPMFAMSSRPAPRPLHHHHGHPHHPRHHPHPRTPLTPSRPGGGPAESGLEWLKRDASGN